MESKSVIEKIDELEGAIKELATAFGVDLDVIDDSLLAELSNGTFESMEDMKKMWLKIFFYMISTIQSIKNDVLLLQKDT